MEAESLSQDISLIEDSITKADTKEIKPPEQGKATVKVENLLHEVLDFQV